MDKRRGLQASGNCIPFYSVYNLIERNKAIIIYIKAYQIEISFLPLSNAALHQRAIYFTFFS